MSENIPMLLDTIDDDTANFVDEHGLQSAVAWLQSETPRFFDGADFEIAVLSAEKGEKNLLALKVYARFEAADFRDRRHRLCAALLAADHRALYELIAVFQRRTNGRGR